MGLEAQALDLIAGDPRLHDLDQGGRAFDNLKGALRAWQDHPEWMDFLDPASPAHRQKLLERAIYLRRWEPFVPHRARVLDLGGGIGRFATWCLDRGCEVELVDPDRESLRRAVVHANGRPGRLRVHWSTAEVIPALAPVDVVIACEVLCYVEHPEDVVRRLNDLLVPGGIVLASVEARNGWLASDDVAPGTLQGWLDGPIVHVPGDRFVRTYDRPMFEALFGGFEAVGVWPSHYVSSGPFERGAGELDLDQAFALDERLAAHPLTREWNRAWSGAFRKPA